MRKPLRSRRLLMAVFISALLTSAGLAAVAGPAAHAAACTVTKDASSPAEVKLANSTATTATTASFSPPAGSLVLAEVSIVYDTNTPTGPVVTAADSGGTSYTAGPSAYDSAAEGTYVFSHYYSSAPGPVTVHSSRTKTGAALYDLNVRVLTGAAASQAGAASMSAHAQSGTSITHAITPAVSGSDIEATAAAGTTSALTASGLTTDSQWNDANDGSSTARGHVTSASLNPVTIGWTVPSSTFWSLAALEVLPASGCAGGAPAVTTNAATSVGNTGAVLNGSVNPEGASTTYKFDYGTTASYGTSIPVPSGSAGSGTTAVNESATVAGLTRGTLYHYRLEATNATGTTFGADQQFTTTTAGLLTWSPPACGGADGLTCTTINLANTGGPQNPSLASNVDYKIVLPSTPLTGGTLRISGGHNVQIIGGEIDLVNPCTDACAAEGSGAIYINRTTPGEVYLEGVWIHNTQTAADTAASCPGGGTSCSTADGIDVNELGTATPATIVMQDMRIDGISGCSGGADHADVFQPYDAAASVIDIDHLTGTSNCQGMQIDPDLAFANNGNLPSYTIKNTNMDVLNNPYLGSSNRYMWWLTYNLACNSGNITLSGDYTQEPNGTMSINSVWPDTDQPAACKSVWSSPTLSFPNSPQISGTLTEGQPAGGDYVTGGGTSAGTGYVSPGYQ